MVSAAAVLFLLALCLSRSVRKNVAVAVMALACGLFVLVGSAQAQVATLYGPVDDESAAQVISAIQDANAKGNSKHPIILFIDSDGGSLGSGQKIIDAMAASRRPVWTVDVGMAASMAAIIFTHGAKRAMFPHAMLMFHHEAGEAEGSAEQIMAQAAVIQKQVTEIERHIAKLAGISLRELREKESATWWLMAKEAVDAHIANQILVLEQYPPPTHPEKRQ